MSNYERINWTTGTKIKEGYTIINGQEYQTVQPEYSGETPINVENLNHMDEGIYEANNKSFIQCYETQDTTATSTSSATKIPLTEALSNGSKLRLANNKVYADKDCNVIVFSQVYIIGGFTTGQNNVISLQVFKNGVLDGNITCYVHSNWKAVNFSGYIISLSSGDYIELGVQPNVSGVKIGKGNGNETFFTVKEL